MDRRLFLLSSVSAALPILAGSAWAITPAARPNARVIVIGGGMAGATVAKYLRLWGDAVAVTSSSAMQDTSRTS